MARERKLSKRYWVTYLLRGYTALFLYILRERAFPAGVLYVMVRLAVHTFSPGRRRRRPLVLSGFNRAGARFAGTARTGSTSQVLHGAAAPCRSVWPETAAALAGRRLGGFELLHGAWRRANSPGPCSAHRMVTLQKTPRPGPSVFEMARATDATATGQAGFGWRPARRSLPLLERCRASDQPLADATARSCWL